ncbi:PHD and RING finger domain-containing protein 1 isoform X1 [Oryctolagus cuniculus]|uniref:PHD and RING finger domain-containing protein 1 isoform X1 n=1 Tax=Oryctolagus cuniculus TaxID=9986 RepID=UPI00387A1A9A
MDDDSLDELATRSPGPDGCPPASDTEGSGGSSEGSEDDTGSEHGDSSGREDEAGASEEEEDEDLGDRYGSEDSEEDAEAVVAVVDAQGKLEASGAFNSDDDAESCPICLNVFRDQAVGTPENCAHYFCLDCIVEWSKNANSCPVDRTTFKCICIRAQFGGKVLKKIPVDRAEALEEEEEDPTFCEVCGRSDREDRLLLCDGCDAGYHMECLEPPLQEVPVDEWFCPECAAPGAAAAPAADAGIVSEEEVSLLLADVVPTTSRLRPRTGRTRAIARTRQSERVRATVNRNRISTARRVQHVPRHLMSSLLEETIEAVATGLSTAVYQRPLTPRAPAKRRRKTGRRKKVPGRRKTQSRPSVRSKKRQHRAKKRGRTTKKEVTTRSRIARTLGLCRPARGTCTPALARPLEPSLSLVPADIGAAPLSVFGDPYELDPFDSSEEPSVSPPSPLSAKRRALSRSALRSHQPVARPVSLGSSRSHLPIGTAEPDTEAAPTPDLLGSILSGQSLLMLDSADVLIHRDGSLSARTAAPVSFQRNSAGPARAEGGSRPTGSLLPRLPSSGGPAHHLLGSRPQSLGSSGPSRPALPCTPVHTGPPVGPDSSAIPGSGPGLRLTGSSRINGSSKQVSAPPKPSSSHSNSTPKSTAPGHPVKPAPRRASIADLPRIPKIRRGGSGPSPSQDSAPAPGQRVELPSACISRLTGREGPGQPGQGTRGEGEPGSRGPQEPSSHTGSSRPPAPSSHCSLPPLGPSRGKGVSSTFESFRINIPGNTAQASRLSSPGFCNTFRPVDSKVQRKESPSPLFSIKKTKQLKSEIYDPFDPTGSDSSPPSSSPESLGASLLPSEITRTISIRSPKAPPLQAVRCVTSYTVEKVFETEAEASRGPSSGTLRLRGAGAAEEEPTGSRGLASPAPEPWDEDRGPCDTFFGSEERTVTCVTVLEPEGPPSPAVPQETTHRVVELRSPSRSRSRSRSSSRGRKKTKRKRVAREHRRTRSGTRSGSRDRSSRSVSPAASEDPSRRHRAKAKSRRSSSERSSSHERAKRKKAKVRGKDRRRDSWGRGHRRTRSRSGSPGSSSYEHRDGRRKKRRRSGSRSRGREYSPPSSLERGWRHKHQRERSRERPERKDSAARPRERRKWRSRSPSAEHRGREPPQPRSHEKRPPARSPERKVTVREASPAPPPQEDPPAGPAAPVQADATPQGAVGSKAPPQDTPVLDALDDLDYGDSVEAGHVFEDFSSDTVLAQLDDMSSPPSPESTDSSPERDFPPRPVQPPASWPPDNSLAMAVAQGEAPLTRGEDTSQPPSHVGGPQEQSLVQDTAGTDGAQDSLGAAPLETGGVPVVAGPEQASQTPLLRSRALVKRVTWNLQEPESSAVAEDRAPRAPLHRPQRPREGAWDVEDGAPAVVTVAAFPEPPPPSHTFADPVFLSGDPSQVYSPYVPPALAQPSSVLPCVPASQPTVQFVLQGSLPLAGCGVAQSLAPVPTLLTTASDPASQATTNNSEEGTASLRPAPEKTKKEEYMKKLHMQERAVEEVKLAIKPFYQKREVTKEEYKDILRKAVQKICHSKSGEINPVKVANLVKAYVDKYRHMRRHRKAEAADEPPAQGAEA